MLFAAVLLLTFSAAAANDIPPYAMEMKTKRVNGLLFRYTRFNAESPFPCLRLELIKPQHNWEIVDKKDICEMNDLSLASNYTYSGFEDIQFTNNSLIFKFNYYSKTTPGEFSQDCSVKVVDDQIKLIECTNAKPVE
jgi:hypothetical protein